MFYIELRTITRQLICLQMFMLPTLETTNFSLPLNVLLQKDRITRLCLCASVCYMYLLSIGDLVHQCLKCAISVINYVNVCISDSLPLASYRCFGASIIEICSVCARVCASVCHLLSIGVLVHR